MARTRNRAAHAGRTLTLLLLGVVVLYGLVAIGGTWKPALGLDLQGGTRITLTAVGDVSQDNLKEAANIIDQRVNGSGVSEAEVTTQGSKYIVVEIPGDTSNSLIDTVKRQAQLRFRTVACVSGSTSDACATSASTDSGSGVIEGGDSGTDSDAGSSSDDDSGKKNDNKGNTSGKGNKSGKADKGSAKNRPGFLAGTADKDKNKKNNGKKSGTKASESPSASSSPTASESADPSESPTASESAGTDTGSSDDKAQMALDFISNPGQDAIDAFNAYSCPTDKAVDDNPDKFLVTCGTDENEGVKFLLSPAAIEGTDLDDAEAAAPDQNSAVWRVTLTIGGDGRGVFADLSRSMVNTNEQFAIVLDGKVISNPGFTGTITDGNAEITGGFTQSSAKSLATSLRYGALPIAFQKDGTQVEQIGPSLAGNQLTAGLTAGAIGLFLVMLYCLLYYRGLGLVVLMSLATAAAITYAMVLLLGHTAGFTLTLPGIAGLIIGVGVTADSFIIFFERIRDEMREGRSMRVAVETGWVRARKTRLAANVVSLLSAAVLYLFATGVVKGFGFALGLSTVIDLVILFWFTKPLVTVLARFKFFNGGGELSGLSANTLGIDRVATGGKA